MQNEKCKMQSAKLSSLKSFGLSVGSIFVLIATLEFYKQRLHLGSALIGAGTLLITVGLLRPRLLQRVHGLWMKFAHALGYINTRLILGLIFFGLFAPIGLILRLLKIDLVQRRPDKRPASYWKVITEPSQEAKSYLNPF